MGVGWGAGLWCGRLGMGMADGSSTLKGYGLWRLKVGMGGGGSQVIYEDCVSHRCPHLERKVGKIAVEADTIITK